METVVFRSLQWALGGPFCYPWSYEENKQFLGKLEKELKSNDANIYFHKQVLVHSKEKRNMHVVTVSSKLGMLD